MSSPPPQFHDSLSDLADFLKAVSAYRYETVLGGGWVPYLYRHLPLVASLPHGPLLTHDFDLVAPSELPRRAVGTLHECLLEGKFSAVRNREPPVVYYQHERWGSEGLAPIYGEILTPLKGAARDRQGRQKDLRAIQNGVEAQQLRYLELLLHEPLTVQAGQVPALGLPVDLAIRIPNPAAYVLQKALVLKHRGARKRPKDLAYVFEVAMLWHHETERVRGMFQAIARASRKWGKWVERGRRVLTDAFEDEHAEGPVSAEHVFGGTADGHLVKATNVYRVVRPFLEEALVS